MLDDPHHDHPITNTHDDGEKAKDWIEEKATEAGNRLEETGQKVGNWVERKTNDNSNT